MMWIEGFIPPAFILIGAGFFLLFTPKILRSSLFIFSSLVTLIYIWIIPDSMQITSQFAGYTLHLCEVDKLSRVFGIIFALISFAGGIYAFHISEKTQQVAAAFYAGSALGVTFAGDYITLFVFWELMAVSATLLVWSNRTKESSQAGMRYLLIHLFGGGMLLAGILLHLNETGSLLIEHQWANSGLSSWLVLGAVALNAAVPPLNAWLPDAYPKATITGAVFLSAFTTKTAVYVLARVFAGWEILLILGVFMTLYGVVYAVLVNDIRKILAYHIISQVGYMVAGVGIGTELALNGTVAHAFSHILYKALLFMGAGAVLYATGKSKLTELGGLFKAIPFAFYLYMAGAFSISGFPLFNGFISKAIVVSAAEYSHLYLAMFLLHLASVGTFLSVGLKLPYFTWFSENKAVATQQVPHNMYVGMGITAFLCVLFGVYPNLLYRMLPFPIAYEPFTIPHFMEASQILLATFVAFWIFRTKLAGKDFSIIDTDWFYRKPSAFLRKHLILQTRNMFDAVEQAVLISVKKVASIMVNPLRIFKIFGDKKTGAMEFDPNEARPRMETIIGLILLCAVIIGIFSLFK